MVRSGFLILLAALLFLVNVGIPVFEHICSKEGVFNSIIFKSTHCEQKQFNLTSCCQKLKAKKNDCCHNETKIIKLKADYTATFNKIGFELIGIYDLKNTAIVYEVPISNDKVAINSFSGKDPPTLLYGRKILIKNQVFRI